MPEDNTSGRENDSLPAKHEGDENITQKEVSQDSIIPDEVLQQLPPPMRELVSTQMLIQGRMPIR